MTEEGINVVKNLITLKEEDNKKKINQIQFDSYFKNSGLVEYKKRLKKPIEDLVVKEKEIIKNDMSKYKFKNK
tara:strand:- start:4116 stop:4334 length:219 start_codon:yes stop_codon:yes gene_type:complete